MEHPNSYDHCQLIGKTSVGTDNNGYGRSPDHLDAVLQYKTKQTGFYNYGSDTSRRDFSSVAEVQRLLNNAAEHHDNFSTPSSTLVNFSHKQTTNLTSSSLRNFSNNSSPIDGENIEQADQDILPNDIVLQNQQSAPQR